jgi:catechol 2,3-dioxygenase-like lactoylglutathione lyase family enzyme
MLLNGLNHVAIITNDTDRLHAFYREVFEATIQAVGAEVEREVRMSIIHVGPYSELNVFEIDGNSEADRQTPMFRRGRIDHMALQAESIESFETIRDRLIARGAADEFVTDFGPMLSLFFRDPDGLECEVCVTNPDAEPGVLHPPGTPAARYQS